jgi:hypothetical protein
LGWSVSDIPNHELVIRNLLGRRISEAGMNIGDLYLKKSKGLILKGVVIKVYEKFFLVQFRYYRECFSNIRDEEERKNG